jgi:hypothetical protein
MELTDEILFDMSIHAFWTNDDRAEAERIYQLGIMWGYFDMITHQESIPRGPQITHLDLHEFSYGAGFVHVAEFQKNHTDISQFAMICSKGEIEKHNVGVFREALLAHFKETYPAFACEVDETNIGRIIVRKVIQ